VFFSFLTSSLAFLAAILESREAITFLIIVSLSFLFSSNQKIN